MVAKTQLGASRGVDLGGWVIRALAALILMLAVGDVALVLANRIARREFAQVRQFIEQTTELNRVNQALVKEIAVAAVDDNDAQLRALLTQRGIRVDAYSPRAATAASSANAAIATSASAPPLDASEPTETVPPPSESEQHFLVRFDDRFAALTPASIRELDSAAAASSAGAPVTIEIEGCPSATHDGAALCARRAYSLAKLLAARGVANPRRLLAGNR